MQKSKETWDVQALVYLACGLMTLPQRSMTKVSKFETFDCLLLNDIMKIPVLKTKIGFTQILSRNALHQDNISVKSIPP